jgi:hypothetical protein
VSGLGGGAVQAILKEHGIDRVLASEGGRTSRGSVARMRTYAAFLNALGAQVDLARVEDFWIGKVREFFAGRPLKLRLDASKSLRFAIRDLLNQALEKERQTKGNRFRGAMLQHLVGAKLDLVLGVGVVAHHPASESDQAEGRAGDFTPGGAAIHVTTHPSEALVSKCRDNLNAGLRPLIVTLPEKAAVADGLAETAGLADRIDILDIEQFLATNLYEHTRFNQPNLRPRIDALLGRYNQLIELHEHDPSLRIEARS